ncbi:MAG: hypothetical protein WC724_01020 [Candidatus Paceibacterota bacterium]
MKKIDFRGGEKVASFMAEMTESGCHELHQLASLIVKAEISAIRIAQNNVAIYFFGTADPVFIQTSENSRIRELFKEDCVIRSEHFWLCMGEICGQFESLHVKATRELWEEWCRAINPFIHEAIPKRKKKVA